MFLLFHGYKVEEIQVVQQVIRTTDAEELCPKREVPQ